MTETTCRCGKPTREGRSFCDPCADLLSQALGEVPWLDEELETTITKRKGIDYRRVGGGSGAKREQPSPPEWTSSNARTHLRGVLVAWVKFCAEEQVRNQSPHQGIPEDSLPAISRWLLWRVDGLALHDIGAEAVEEITSAVAHCHRLIDRPADRQYLGNCDACDEGRLYARPGGAWAKCNTCGQATEAEKIRERLLTELDDRLCTAAEIAHLSTYLGLKATREQVRKRVEYLARTDQVTRVSSFSDTATYRFGDVYPKIAAAEYGRVRAG